jgi:integrase/recombinase XerD
MRSLFSYLQTFGYTGANPAHGKFVSAPPVPRDGKTPGLTPKQCRLLLDVPDPETPLGIRDRAMLAVLAYSACRVGELTRLRLKDFVSDGDHRVLRIHGKGGRERTVALHPEGVERLAEWLAIVGIPGDPEEPLFCPSRSPQKKGWDGFLPRALTVRSVEKLVKKYARQVGLDSQITVHSFRVTALTTAREHGCDLVDLQDFAGHADPRTTLAYIRNRQRLSKSPTYTLHY